MMQTPGGSAVSGCGGSSTATTVRQASALSPVTLRTNACASLVGMMTTDLPAGGPSTSGRARASAVPQSCPCSTPSQRGLMQAGRKLGQSALCATVRSSPELETKQQQTPTKSKRQGSFADTVNTLLFGAASRLERGTTTCVHCRGQGTQDCENCSGRGLASPKQPKSNAGKLANKVQSLLGKEDVTYESSWRVTNRCAKCRGGGRVRCSHCDGLGTRGDF